jgi:hypothetical protein
VNTLHFCIFFLPVSNFRLRTYITSLNLKNLKYMSKRSFKFTLPVKSSVVEPNAIGGTNEYWTHSHYHGG